MLAQPLKICWGVLLVTALASEFWRSWRSLILVDLSFEEKGITGVKLEVVDSGSSFKIKYECGKGHDYP